MKNGDVFSLFSPIQFSNFDKDLFFIIWLSKQKYFYFLFSNMTKRKNANTTAKMLSNRD